ncbi:hypothetical protein L204_100923 [Cryptococcus depauperatus]|nr:hypothetical protein L204_01144 [Cryptococcus depauperatus CBS 7855]
MPSPPLCIVQSLSPRIAVLTSDDVVESCEANGCRGLEELLRPWEGATERVSVLSSTLTPTVHPTFPLRFVAYDTVYKNPATSSPSPDVLVDIISSSVGVKKPEENQHYPLTRSLLISSRPVAPYETFNHPVGVLLAVSTATSDPLGTLARLHGRTIGPSSVAWLDVQTVLRFYVVIHDVSQMGDDMAPAHGLLGNVKKIYGPHSTLLVINSQIERRSIPPSPDISTHPTIPLTKPFTLDDVNPSALSQVYASALSSLTLSPMSAAPSLRGIDEPTTPTTPANRPPRRKLYGSKLTVGDTQRLAALVRELAGQSLVPWMETRIREWNEVYHANRRGITGRLFGAGRKLFSSRPNSPASSSSAGYNAQAGYYPLSSVEALSRRLADFAFMLRDYRFAAGVYDSLRRDFAQDRAFRYASAATEMYGLSLLLSHPYFSPSVSPSNIPSPFTNLQHTEIMSWLEQALVSYHQSGPAFQIQIDALRITILYYEAWKAIKEWRGVGAVLAKSAGEAEEVPNAVLIEEAANADVKGVKDGRGKRRRAFHLLLAARRYETVGLKSYSRRCLEQASNAFRSSSWTAAQDWIEYSLGRQAYTLGKSDIAVEHFLRLLKKEETTVIGSQGGILEDMKLAYEQLCAHPDMLEASEKNLQLLTPVFDNTKTRITTPSYNSSCAVPIESKWRELEKQALISWDRKKRKPTSLLPNEEKIEIGADEQFTVELVATNPLNASLIISNLSLAFSPSDCTSILSPNSITLDPYETRTISILVTITLPSTTSSIKLVGVSYKFHDFFPCNQTLERKGKRLHTTKNQRVTPTYAQDTSLTLTILPERPRITVELLSLPQEIYTGEQVECILKIKNIGRKSIGALDMIWNEEVIIRKKDTKHNDIVAQAPNYIAPNKLTTIYPDTIMGGDEVGILVSLTSFSPSALDLFGFLVFEAEDGETGSITVEHRIEIRPLAGLEALIRPIGKETTEYSAVLEVRNISGETLRIENLCGVSSLWNLECKPIDVTLLPNQTFCTILPVQQASTKLDMIQSAVVTALGRLVQGQPLDEVSADLSPTNTLVCRPPDDVLLSYLAARRIYRMFWLTENFPTITKSLLPNLFPLFDPLELDIILSYSISSATIRKGHLNLHSLRPAPSFSSVESIRRQVEQVIISGTKQTRTMYEETGRLRRMLISSVLDGCLGIEEDPTVVLIKAGKNGIVEHDFGNGPCRVPVTFTIQNRSPQFPIRYILQLVKPTSIPSTSSDTVSLQLPRFIGSLSHRGTLSPGQSATIEKQVWFDEAGVMSLKGWQLVVETGEDQDGWRPRESWSKVGGEKIIEVRGKSVESMNHLIPNLLKG